MFSFIHKDTQLVDQEGKPPEQNKEYVLTYSQGHTVSRPRRTNRTEQRTRSHLFTQSVDQEGQTNRTKNTFSLTHKDTQLVDQEGQTEQNKEHVLTYSHSL